MGGGGDGWRHPMSAACGSPAFQREKGGGIKYFPQTNE